MPSKTGSRLLMFALLSTAACQRDDAGDRTRDVQADSGAIATAAANVIVSSLRGTSLSDTAARRSWLLAPGPTSWDTMLVDALRRAEPAIAEPGDDTALVTTVSTHGFVSRGDTVDVTVVVRSCVRSDTVFNFTKDSLVHRLVRTGAEGEGTWQEAGAVTHDHSVGECEPVAAPGGDPPNG